MILLAFVVGRWYGRDANQCPVCSDNCFPVLRYNPKTRALEEDETSDFFSWFDKDNEDEEFIGQPMKDIWEEPVKVREPLFPRLHYRLLTLCPGGY